MAIAAQSENKPKALLFVLACVVLWAFIPVVSKLGQNNLDNYQFLFWSSLLSLIVLLAGTLTAGKIDVLRNYNRQQVTYALGLGSLGTFLYYLLLYFGYAHAKGLEVLAIQYTWPVFIVIFSIAFLQERLTLRTTVAILLGFAGVILVITNGDIRQLQFNNSLVDFVVLVAAAIFGVFSVLSKKTKFEAFSAATLFFISASVFSFISMLAFSSFTLPSARSMIPIVVNGALVNGISYVLWLKALGYAKASYLAPFVFMTPVLAALLIVAFFGEVLLPAYVIGLGLVIVAGLAANG
ncbi:hypothetical protein AUJ14_04070 [Candidatus Micrarchaeota archaeon CG1_02_55_22]|nr:MAG: hypothetical protein AUJ14_04070 [Candidatus Micrarchaeota archaeon CG1_02_55_22]